jgi:hypothetical protein
MLDVVIAPNFFHFFDFDSFWREIEIRGGEKIVSSPHGLGNAYPTPRTSQEEIMIRSTVS